MKAMIFAAGRGDRMRPLTDACPKPLLPVGGKPLIVWQIEALARAGMTDIVINHAWLGAQLEAALGDGMAFGVRIHWSAEGTALETAGGIAKALPLLGDAFWVLAGDVFVPSFRFEAGEAEAFRAGDDWGRIWLVPNPPHVPQGDFAVDGAQRVWRKDQAPADARTGTYSTIGLYRPAIVDGVRVGDKAALRPSLERAIDAGRLSARWLEGEWTDVGTPERLAALNAD